MTKKLYVICGHGAGDPGSCGGGKSEADLVRKLAKKMAAVNPNVVALDTARNWYVDGGVNASLKKKIGSNPVIELHMDSASASAKGGHVIICSGLSADKEDMALASYIAKQFPGRSNSIAKRSDLANPKRAKAQGINYRLLECCFISNKSDREKFIGNMGSIAKGIVGCFGLDSAETAYKVVKDGLWVWDAPGKGTRKLKRLKAGQKLKVVSTQTKDGNLWASYVSSATGKTRWFKIKSADGKKVYAKKA
ncbi:N-acetylmuramoyl-L-alanine amidase [Eggerthellaceae bacterium 24-137]